MISSPPYGGARVTTGATMDGVCPSIILGDTAKGLFWLTVWDESEVLAFINTSLMPGNSAKVGLVRELVTFKEDHVHSQFSQTFKSRLLRLSFRRPF